MSTVQTNASPALPSTEAAPAVQEFRAWQRDVVAASAFACEPIAFADIDGWEFVDGILRHRTRGFFSLAGLAVDARRPELDGQQQLAILQPETAINGFLIRRRDGRGEVLFQGRVEPGNIGGLQLAPTVQSTEANYKRLHGGGATPFIDWFVGDRVAPTPYDELQSEEATRYYGKYNRNVVRLVAETEELELPATYRWFGLDAIRAFAATSNVLNTDARSVLAGVDWRLLADDGRPFGRHRPGTFGAALADSFAAGAELDPAGDADVLAWLARLRVACAPRHRVLPLDELEGWEVTSTEIREREPRLGFRARAFRVTAHGREVAGWDQPLIDSSSVGRLALIAQPRDGVLRFLVKASYEIGFLEGVQCGTSVTVVPGAEPNPGDEVEAALLDALAAEDPRRATVLCRCRQSEEGGRFYRDENDYEVAVLDPTVTLPDSPHYRWLTLAQIARLIRVPGTFSMEFRGTLALLLHWL